MLGALAVPAMAQTVASNMPAVPDLSAATAVGSQNRTGADLNPSLFGTNYFGATVVENGKTFLLIGNVKRTTFIGPHSIYSSLTGVFQLIPEPHTAVVVPIEGNISVEQLPEPPFFVRQRQGSGSGQDNSPFGHSVRRTALDTDDMDQDFSAGLPLSLARSRRCKRQCQIHWRLTIGE